MDTRIVAYIASILAVFWFGRESNWASFSAAASMVVAHLAIDKRNRNRPEGHIEADLQLYAEFQRQLPFNPQIRYLRDQDMRAPIDTERLNSLDEFVHSWDDEAHKFHDRRLESVRADLIEAAREFLTYLSLNTFPLSQPTISKIPDEWRHENREHYDEVANRLNGDATKIVVLYEELVRRARKRLKV